MADPVPDPRDWRERAACRGVEPTRRLCASCTVRFECLYEALKSGELYGLWGGFDPDERRLLMRRSRGNVDEAMVRAYRGRTNA